MGAVADLRRRRTGGDVRQALVARLPGLAAVIGAEDADGGDADPHAARVGRVDQDSMQAQAPAARTPLFPRGVPGQAADLFPGEPAVAADEQAGLVHACVERIRF